ncbi:hypothetical protein HDU82_005456 [Entophlyctis luteolus]|nr:hypothetical protein HDU82_005456 [Entophlyctis luteolus]
MRISRDAAESFYEPSVKRKKISVHGRSGLGTSLRRDNNRRNLANDLAGEPRLQEGSDDSVDDCSSLSSVNTGSIIGDNEYPYSPRLSNAAQADGNEYARPLIDWTDARRTNDEKANVCTEANDTDVTDYSDVESDGSFATNSASVRMSIPPALKLARPLIPIIPSFANGSKPSMDPDAELRKAAQHYKTYGNMPNHLRLALMRKRNLIPNWMGDKEFLNAISNNPNSEQDVHFQQSQSEQQPAQSARSKIFLLAKDFEKSANAIEDEEARVVLEDALSELKELQTCIETAANSYFSLKAQEISLEREQINFALSLKDATSFRELSAAKALENHKQNNIRAELNRDCLKRYAEQEFLINLKSADDSFLRARSQIRDGIIARIKADIHRLNLERNSAKAARDEFKMTVVNPVMYLFLVEWRMLKIFQDEQCKMLDSTSINEDLHFLKMTMS